MRNFLCIGHRGAKGLEPENTLRSIRRALDLGVDGVEIDAWFVDGEVIVIHDDTLERTTNGHGLVQEQTFDYLRSLDAGKGEKIPTLREVFETVDGRAFINVELKGPATAEPVFKLIREYMDRRGWKAENFLVSSFDHGELAKLKGRGIRLGPLFSEQADYAAVAGSLGAYSINMASRLLDESVVAAAHVAGLKTFVYTVNESPEIEQMRAIGVDGIFTDRPDRMEKKNKPIQVANPPARPLMLFDGDCGFCRYWVERWRHVTGDRVDYETSQEAGAEYPEIPPGEFQRAVQFVETDGRVTGGADAVFRALEYAPRKSALLGFLALPVFRPLARIAYRIIASNRTFFSFLTRVFFDRR